MQHASILQHRADTVCMNFLPLTLDAAGPPGVSRKGVHYIRWGKTSCNNTGAGTELLYSGTAGGPNSQQRGGGSKYLCLPDTPEFISVTPGADDNRGEVFASEYESASPSPAFVDLLDSSVPCAACFTAERGNKIMIPARTLCPSSWTMEYTGYLMAAASTPIWRMSYVCVDVDAEMIAGTESNDGGALMYFTEVVCTGIECPPYTAGYELACVVCTK